MNNLDNALLIRLLTEYRDSLSLNVEKVFVVDHVNAQIQLLSKRHVFSQVRSQGGTWLGSARDWIQRHAINGSDVHWGTDEELRMGVPVTVQLIEDLAAQIATATVNDFKGIDRRAPGSEQG